MRQRFINFFQTASLILLIVGIALLSAITTMHFAIHGSEVTVPNLKQMTVADARSQAAGMGLVLDVDNRYYSADVAAGHILSQSPAPGTVVRREWHLRVAESLGPQKVEVPDTIGMDERVASLQLRRVGLDVGARAHLQMAGMKEGTVIAQDPPAGARGIESPSVSLLIAAGEDDANDKMVMPSYVGLPVTAAQAQLQRAGFQFDRPEYIDVFAQQKNGGGATNQPIAPGNVVGQEPEAGMRVDRSVTVHLIVAK